MKFVLFVEGHTEEKALPEFLKRWLDPQLTEPVGIQAVRFEGAADILREAPARAHRFLNAPKGNVLAVIALLDLYHLPLPFPNDTVSPSERAAWAKTHLEHQVGHARFRQFFAVHETEAWLLSDPAIFPAEVRASLKPKAHQPETVNDTQPPARLLDSIYLSKTRHHYSKVLNGAELFKRLSPQTACDRCPHLKALLDELLRLAQTLEAPQHGVQTTDPA